MSAVVFCGPTLAAADRERYRGFDFLPPVRQGELHAAALRRPRAIGIVDGFFDGQPAVWHKEILWAMSQGIAVFGAASMGALRAAELHAFGMRGVGRIFEDYRDGRLEDDDEVALIHGPEEIGYVRLSEPMVNIRATLEAAARGGVIDAAMRRQLVDDAKSLFYQDRTWDRLVEALPADGEGRQRLKSWLKANKVDRKREDALEMLDAMAGFMAAGTPPAPASFRFEWTESWETAPWRTDAGREDAETSAEQEAILDELRLDGSYLALRREALLRLLVAEGGVGEPVRPDRKAVVRATEAFRSARGLARQADVERWATDNDIDAADVERMLREQAGVDQLALARDRKLGRRILDLLRENGRYKAMRKRVRAKARWLKENGEVPAPMTPTLLHWFFKSRRKERIPDDIEDHARELGFDDPESFIDALSAEFFFHDRNPERKSVAKTRKTG
ncbi:MAG: TfuA-like protein [Mesorhizobium sp.]